GAQEAGAAAPGPDSAMTGTAPAQLAAISMKRAASGFMQAGGRGRPRRMRDDGEFTPVTWKWLFPQGCARRVTPHAVRIGRLAFPALFAIRAPRSGRATGVCPSGPRQT